MRVYEVRPGDSPASIAAAHAGCPRCSIDLVRAAPHKPAVKHPNGYVSFVDLRVGEKLVLPEKWFTPEFDALPPAYFAALPHPDGVTPSKLGVAAAGVLGDYAALDAAAAKVGSLASMSDQPFSDAVNDTAYAIDMSVHEVDEGLGEAALRAGPYAQSARKSAESGRQRNVGLISAITTGDRAAAFQARRDILSDFSAALAFARLALQTFYGSGTQTTPTPSSTQPTTGGASTSVVAAAAQAAAAAIGADPSYCAMVSQPGSAVNSAVHAFKTAWNIANPGSPVPINTGTYEQATADAIARAIGAAPAACAASSATPSTSMPAPPIVVPPQERAQGLSVGAILGIGLLGAGAVGGAIYMATREPPVRVRRVRRVQPIRRARPRPTWGPT